MKNKILFLIALLFASMQQCVLAGGKFEAGNGTFMLDGQPFVVKAAELHYPRIPKPYWDQRIKMCKALPGKRYEGDSSSRSVCMCRMGNGWPAMVAAEEKVYSSAKE